MMLFAFIVLLSSLSSVSAFHRISQRVVCRPPRTVRHLTSMNIFDRFFRVVTSNINNVLKKLEDPEKVIEQAVLDMQNDLIRIRQSYAEISEALSRRQIQLESIENLDKSLQMQTNAVNKLYSSMMALEVKISEAKRQKETMIARARTAKTSVTVNDMLSSLGESSSMDAFERMKEKVESLETQAEVAGELAANSAGTSVQLEERFRSLEGNTRVEDELNQMRRQLPKYTGNSNFAQLPSSIERDLEYEKLKRDLGKF